LMLWCVGFDCPWPSYSTSVPESFQPLSLLFLPQIFIIMLFLFFQLLELIMHKAQNTCSCHSRYMASLPGKNRKTKTKRKVYIWTLHTFVVIVFVTFSLITYFHFSCAIYIKKGKSEHKLNFLLKSSLIKVAEGSC
jgi:Na+/proline symporter